MTQPFVPVFDGHNDLLLRLWLEARRTGAEPDAVGRRPNGHLDLERAREGGFAGGLFAAFVPSGERPASVEDAIRDAGPDQPLPEAPDVADAQRATLAMMARLFRLERASGGALSVCRSAGEIRACLEGGTVAAVLHIEGAEAIDTGLEALDVYHQSGLRSLGPVWSRSNAFAHGVPFRFPGGPDAGPGLTEAGRALVRACNERRILVDLSHMTEQGFWDVAAITDAPLVASHSNAHALCPHSRNLTDRQLAAIGESGGIVGVNFATSFLRPDGRVDPDTALETVVRHFHHLIAHAGLDCVGFGSDFDGAVIPRPIGDVTGLPRLVEALRAHGYDEAALAKLAHGNWLRVLERTWGA